MRTLSTMLLASAFAACHAPDDGGSPAPAAATPAAPSPIAEFEFPSLPDQKLQFDCSLVPAETRLDFLKGAIRSYIANRLNGVHTRHEKDEKVMAFNAYETAIKADPLQTAVPKPEGERPSAPDYKEAYDRAVKDLQEGKVRRQGDEPKAKKSKDPVVATVTDVVTREVFNSRKVADPKYTYIMAKAEVGTDGVAYLERMIAAKVEGGADKAQLEKMRDEKYINPAKAMHGIGANKKLNDLPSIL